jgi:hypothetical protein
MIKRLDSTSTTSSTTSSNMSLYSLESSSSARRSLSTNSPAAVVDPALMPRAYHQPSEFKSIDTQQDGAHNASINRHLLSSSQSKAKDQKSSYRVKGLMWAITAARV